MSKAAHQVVAQIQDVSNLVGLDTQEPDAVSIMALMTRFAQGDAPFPSGAVTVASPRPITSRAAAVSFLRSNGVLPTSNASDAASDVYVSDTGEIKVDVSAERMTVVTPHTEAIAFSSLDQPLQLGQLWIGSVSGGVLLAVSSLDGQTVANSSKLLLVFATNARNTDMVFSDSEEKTVSDFGSLPVEIKVEYVWFRLPIHAPWRISPISLDGTVQPPVMTGDGSIGLNVELWNNASALPNPPGPTTYFLIERV